MNKGTISDIKPGMLVKLVGSVGPDLGIVYHADNGILNVLLLDNINGNVPTRVDVDEISCAWDLSQLATYVISDLLQGCAIGWTSVLDNALVYRSVRPEAVEMTLEEISELVSKQLGKPVTVTVKESESCESERDKTEGKVDDCSESDKIEVAVGECVELDGITYRCVVDMRQRSPYCDGCELSDKFCADFECSSACRSDGISVHFVKIDGEPTDKVIHVAAGERLDRDAQIGEEFEIAGDVYRAVEDSSCSCRHCDLEHEDLCGRLGACCSRARSDGKSIAFKRIPAQITGEQKPTIAREIHNLYEVEPAVGYVIEVDGKKLKALEHDKGCVGCYFCDDDIDSCKHIICAGRHRKDGKNIVLQEVEEEQ